MPKNEYWNADALRKKMADSHPSLTRGRVWCHVCGVTQKVNSADCLRSGWPKCCGSTMSIDSPEEREALKERT